MKGSLGMTIFCHHLPNSLWFIEFTTYCDGKMDNAHGTPLNVLNLNVLNL